MGQQRWFAWNTRLNCLSNCRHVNSISHVVNTFPRIWFSTWARSHPPSPGETLWPWSPKSPLTAEWSRTRQKAKLKSLKMQFRRSTEKFRGRLSSPMKASDDSFVGCFQHTPGGGKSLIVWVSYRIKLSMLVTWCQTSGLLLASKTYFIRSYKSNEINRLILIYIYI